MAAHDRTWDQWLEALWSNAFERPGFARATLPELDAERDGALLESANALAFYTPRIAEAFLRAAPLVAEPLDPDAFQAWVNGGQMLAPQHWELAVEYFRVAPRVVPMLGPARQAWLRGCRQLADVHMPLGLTAMRHSPPFLATAGAARLEVWFAGALRLAQHTARGPQTADAFLTVAAPVIARATDALVERWVDALRALGNAAPGAARDVLDRDWVWFADLSEASAAHVLDLGARFRGMSAALAKEWWVTVAAAAPALPPEVADSVLDIATAVSRAAPMVARELVEHAPGVVAQIPARHHATLLQLTRTLAQRHAPTALDFFTTSGNLYEQLTPDEIRTWFDEGLALLEGHPEAASAYFRQESQPSAARLRELRQVVHVETVAPVLQRYAEGLCGARLAVRATEDLPFAMRTLSAELPTTDGRTIYLPPAIDRHGNREDNFGEYKLATAHQSGYFEFGTFRFDLDALADHPQFEALLTSARARGPLPPALSDFERFFTFFAQPPLARDIFAACEDARVDQHLVDHYPGLRAGLSRAVADALAQRPRIQAMPLRQATVEWLVRLSLSRLELEPAPDPLHPLDAPLRHLLGHVLHHGATVSDAALATMQIYTLLVRLPNRMGIEADVVAELAEQAPTEFAEGAAEGDAALMIPEAAEDDLPYTRAEDPTYRGVLRPEMVQKQAVVEVLQDALREHADQGQPLSAELLRQLLELGVNINIKKLDLQQLLDSSDLFITDMENRPGLMDMAPELDTLTPQEREQFREVIDQLAIEVLDDPLEAERVFYYDEWSADIGDYLHRWCRVKEVPVEPGAPEVVHRIIREQAGLIRSVRQQFQMVKPEQLRKVRRLHDGEELDLNDAIAAVIDRRSRRPPDERIYQERQRQQRDVATLFLIDVSASTDEWIEADLPEAAEEPEDAPPSSTPPRPLTGLDDLRALWDPEAVREVSSREIAIGREQRIIDVERSAVIVMAEALQGLGDEYAIYGFSGYGRENVDLFPVKTFAEPYGDRVRARLAGLEPHKSTRMGAAIRHATAQLAEQPARIKTLILLSDGYPQDMDYGKDRTSRTYGLNDTMVALQEARQAGVLAFCLTVDQAGHDYLRNMCSGRDYLVIDDVRALPRELPKVYRGLTG